MCGSPIIRLFVPYHEKDGEVERKGHGGVEEKDRAECSVQSLEGEGI